MESSHFDDLARLTAQSSTRRTALGALAGTFAAGLGGFGLISAKKRKNKKKKCRKANQGCGGKKKCCKGLTCTDGTCLPPNQPECTVNNDCGINETCQNGVCVPNDFECAGDDDCDNDEICVNGECVPAPECVDDEDCGNDLFVCQNGECVFEPECELDIDCPDNFRCIGGICLPAGPGQ